MNESEKLLNKKKRKAFKLWRTGVSISEISRQSGAARNTAAKWVKGWANDPTLAVQTEQTPIKLSAPSPSSPIKMGRENREFKPGAMVTISEAAASFLANLQSTHEQSLERSEDVKKQRQVSTLAINLTGLSFQEIARRIRDGESALKFTRELVSLTSALEKAQKVFLLSHGLATDNFKVDIEMVSKLMGQLPDEALEVLSRSE